MSSKNKTKVKSINNSTFDKNTIKEVVNERIFNSLNNEDKYKMSSILSSKTNKYSSQKNKRKLNNYYGIKNGKNIYKKSYFNYNSSQNNEKGFNYIRNKNENEKIDLNNDFIEKKTTIIKIK